MTNRRGRRDRHPEKPLNLTPPEGHRPRHRPWDIRCHRATSDRCLRILDAHRARPDGHVTWRSDQVQPAGTANWRRPRLKRVSQVKARPSFKAASRLSRRPYQDPPGDGTEIPNNLKILCRSCAARSLERRNMRPDATNPADLGAGEIHVDRIRRCQGITGDVGRPPRGGPAPWPASRCLSDGHQEQPPLRLVSGSKPGLGFH